MIYSLKEGELNYKRNCLGGYRCVCITYIDGADVAKSEIKKKREWKLRRYSE